MANIMDEEFEPSEHQHMRFNPLKSEWVLVSPHRMKRPWMGQIENTTDEDVPEFDPENPLCPGNKRANGEENPDYTGTFVFPNDFPALEEQAPCPEESNDPLFQTKAAHGTCRVMCFHPKTNVTIPVMSISEINLIIDEWIEQMKDLGRKYCWVQIFENKGAIMGCSNPHPHCQIWASSFMPNEPRQKDFYQQSYYKKFGRPMLADYVEKEILREERVVFQNDDWVVLVPYWASWPYETMILPKVHLKRLTDIKEHMKPTLSEAMKHITTKYDNLFQCSFPYTMGWHGAPTGSKLKNDLTHWMLHAMYLPPLLRSSTIKKFMVGYELLAQVQRDMTPEDAAQTLRDLPMDHYSLVKDE